MPKKRLKVDFHVHSHFSPDGEMSPEEIVEMAKKIGLDARAVTDHNTIKGGQETEKIAKGLVIFTGSEIKTREGEIIGLNLKKDIPSDLSLTETCKLIKEQEGFVIVPHPFDRLRSGVGKSINKIIEYIDAVEVLNARSYFDKFNKNALDFAEENNLPKVAGSDAHFGMELGYAYTLVDSEKQKGRILEAVRKGETKTCGGKSGVCPHWKTFVKNVKRKF
jgi:hypothetical protein